MRQAEALFREAVEVGRRVTAASLDKVESLLHHARLVQQFGRNPLGAAPIVCAALDMPRAIHPDDHQNTATVMGELAHNQRDLGHLRNTEPLARESELASVIACTALTTATSRSR
jgi:hypothetical protein